MRTLITRLLLPNLAASVLLFGLCIAILLFDHRVTPIPTFRFQPLVVFEIVFLAFLLPNYTVHKAPTRLMRLGLSMGTAAVAMIIWIPFAIFGMVWFTAAMGIPH